MIVFHDSTTKEKDKSTPTLAFPLGFTTAACKCKARL